MSYVSFKRSYQISPIMLVGGIAGNVQGAAIPIMSLTDPANWFGLVSGSISDTALDEFFAHFEPVAGSTLASNEIAHYPFANMAVAANAVIVQPLKISLLMRSPARGSGGFATKLSTMTALKSNLDQHIIKGGTFTVATPAYLYTNLLLLELRLLQTERADQPQSIWQWDFEQPLLTQSDAEKVHSVSLSRMKANLPQSGDPPALSGGKVNVGTTGSVAGVGAVPAQKSLATGAAPGPTVSPAASLLSNPATFGPPKARIPFSP